MWYDAIKHTYKRLSIVQSPSLKGLTQVRYDFWFLYRISPHPTRLFQRYFIACDVTDVIPDISNSAHTIYFPLYEGDVSRCAMHAHCGYRENYATALFYTVALPHNHSTIAHTLQTNKGIYTIIYLRLGNWSQKEFTLCEVGGDCFKIPTSANSRSRDWHFTELRPFVLRVKEV